MTEPALSLDAALKIVEIASIIGGGAIVIYRMGRMTSRFEMIGETQSREITELKRGIEKMGIVVTDLAVQKNRLDSQAERINMLDKRYEELRHGEGFVFPLDAHLPQAARK